ncbi:post-transcriptional regulator [Halalkalibacter alkaliphilus]|uniref:Post-transcriptional regulator n=1 Tax=Halalkalibacter alkaliphilus TaxID=2917993 RepID=A0A9X2A0D8_9BACI|nr:post-transcriptional regulator [Halalkalibacter alkaliphilus]MCL7746947.1 post-transcriptional regulator [Halalkalibacter alkaliphilus]
MEKQQFEVWRSDVEPALVSKVDEFHFLGYDRATKDDVWECVLYQLRKKKEFIHINSFVSELLTLKPQTYMTWLTVNAYKDPTDWFREMEAAEGESI